MTEPQREVDVVLLTAWPVEYDALRDYLVDVDRHEDLVGGLWEVGTVQGTGARVALGRGLHGSAQAEFETHTQRARSFFHARAVLFLLTAAAAPPEPCTGDVVVATRVHGTPQMWGTSPYLQSRAADLAGTAWWKRLSGDPLSRQPCDVVFGEVVSGAQRQSFALGVADSEGEGARAVMAADRNDVPALVIYGVLDEDVDLSTRIPREIGSAARFAMTLAVSLISDGEEGEQLRTMGHGDRVARTDLLAREAFVASLAELLAHRAAPGTDEDQAGPTVIAVEGAWGAGKSTLMDMTRARLELADGLRSDRGPWNGLVGRWRQRKLRAWDADLTLRGWLIRPKQKSDVDVPQVLTAVFNPWSYQTGEHVWAGLNDCIVGTGAPVIAKNSSSSLQRFWFAHNVERLDRRHVQRTLRKRIVSPLLRLGVFALPVPLLAQLLRDPKPFRVFGFDVAPVDLTLWIVGVLLGIGLLHTASRYLFRAADTLLPAELFGPSGAMGAYSAAVGPDDPLRDPHHRVRKGMLHSAQEDVHRLICELGEAGTRLVVFIDDLDRCSPRTTADVFEAINGFLSGSFPSIRFVLGIDAAATAAHLDAAYSALVAADAGRDAADPSPGWTFLRKLIQLPLPLPRVVRTHVEPLLTGLLGTPHEVIVLDPGEPQPAPPPRIAMVSEEPAVEAGEYEAGEIRTAPAVLALEHDKRVRERFAERLRAQPDLSVREAKRILTVWMFYVRVLDRLSPLRGLVAVRRACRLVLLAEIVARWPASQRCLHRRVEGRHGLAALATAVHDNALWEIEVRRFGLTGDRHRAFRDGVRKILRDYDGEEIAKLAEQLT